MTTLGAASAAQRQDTIVDGEDRQFYLQYFFPNSSVGEVRCNKDQPMAGSLKSREFLATDLKWPVS